LEPQDHNSQPQLADLPSPMKTPAGRFVYASGARPLAGYTIKRGVGQGGFGEIYYAVSDAGKDVALKLIRRNLDVELRGLHQCLNLKHPNLLSLHDIRTDEQGDTWVVMEYVADPSLDVILSQRPAGLSPQEALNWIHGIGAGVAYLHDRGIVHRDLKPGNIFRDEGIVKVGDYGLSKFISCSRRSGHTESVGTVHYMAPEVANGRYGKELDVYAMGVIFFELLTGRVPFEGESIGEVLMKHLTAKPDVSMVEEPYRSIIARALEKDPKDRYSSAGEMMAAMPPYHNGIGPDHSFLGSASNTRDNRRETPKIGHLGKDALKTSWSKLKTARITGCYEAGSYCRRLWHEPKSKKTLRIIVLVALIAWFIAGSQSANGINLPLLPIILIAFVVTKLVMSFSEKKRAEGWSENPTVIMTPDSPSPQTAKPVIAEPLGESTAKPPRWPPWYEKSSPALVVKASRERLAELIGSLLISTLAAAIVSGVMVMLDGYWADVQIQPEQFVWLWLIGIFGSWAVLIPSKLWEGHRGDPILRRFVMMVIGMAIGLAAYGAGDILMVNLRRAADFPNLPNYKLPTSFFAIDGRPLMMAYVASFATLFLLMRWWRQADPMRRAKLRVWTLLVSVLVAIVVAQAWQFPQPWLPMVACTISAAVQLASPFEHAHRRKR
jgi:eukaryotic-like serine/threonine-protein kinase